VKKLILAVFAKIKVAWPRGVALAESVTEIFAETATKIEQI